MLVKSACHAHVADGTVKVNVVWLLPNEGDIYEIILAANPPHLV